MLLLLMCIGVIGYRYISGYEWIDAIYMTVITITTVGFAEVSPLDTASKIFTIFLILASVVIVGYAIAIITEYILSKNNFEDIKQRKMQKKIDAMSNHIIICGFGRNGKQAAKKLEAYNKPYVIIERNKDFDKKHTKVISTSKEVERSYSISVKNKKNIPIMIFVQDQVPVTNNESITITPAVDNGGSYNEDTGIIEWKLNIDAGTEAKIEFGYTIKMPKKYNVN